MCRISSAAILRRWGSLGHILRVSAKWAPMQALIEAVERYSQAHREELRRVLQQSDASLQPLSDPLTPNLGLNRWLAVEREESYSDWLAWVIQQLTTDQVLAVFGISRDSQAFDSRAKPVVGRERPIAGGRLDIKVTVGEDILLVIEVKKTSEQQAYTDKQKGYSKPASFREWVPA